ncbi:RNA-binding protein [Candidatus Woesearchaeota archaeon]|nr:RNA-binding protein [Candidatus Woesearchaeota archaeon]
MRKVFSNSEKRELGQRLSPFGLSFSKKDKVEQVDDFILLDGAPVCLVSGDIILPTLKAIISRGIRMSRVVVDMGAVKFVASGADIMRPGIVSFDDFHDGALVLVVDEKHGKPLAVGQAKYSSGEMKRIDKGKVIRNIHYVGDRIWNS